MLKPKLKFSSFFCPALGLELGAGQVTQFDKNVLGIQVGSEHYIIPRGEGIAYYVKVVVAPVMGKGSMGLHPFANMRP